MKWLMVLLLFCSSVAHAQRVVNVDNSAGVDQSMFQVINGEPFVNVKFVSLVSGSPYFRDEWMPGRAVSWGNKQTFAGIYKLDLVDNQIHFLDRSVEKVATHPLKNVILLDSITGQLYTFTYYTYLPATASNRKGWFLELATGKANLYQHFNKRVMESKPYNSATVEQRISTIDEYYIQIDSAITQIKKLKEASAVFPSHQAEVNKFIEQNDGKGKLGDKLVALVKYYNSL